MQSVLSGDFCIGTSANATDHLPSVLSLKTSVGCAFWRILDMDPLDPLWKQAVTSAKSYSSQHCTIHLKSDLEHCVWSEKSSLLGLMCKKPDFFNGNIICESPYRTGRSSVFSKFCFRTIGWTCKRTAWCSCTQTLFTGLKVFFNNLGLV